MLKLSRPHNPTSANIHNHLQMYLFLHSSFTPHFLILFNNKEESTQRINSPLSYNYTYFMRLAPRVIAASFIGIR